MEDNCGEVHLEYEDILIDGDCMGFMEFERWWYIQDDCGNGTWAFQTFKVEKDETAPVFYQVPEDKVLECGSEEIVFDEPLAYDNCSMVHWQYEDEVIGTDCESGMEYIRTWTAMDDCGNSASISQRIFLNWPTDQQEEDLLKNPIIIDDSPQLEEPILNQNNPNPFVDETLIGFYLPESTTVHFVVFDVSGRTIWETNGEFSAGYQELILDNTSIPTNGLLYYRLKTATFSQTKKMLKLQN